MGIEGRDASQILKLLVPDINHAYGHRSLLEKMRRTITEKGGAFRDDKLLDKMSLEDCNRVFSYVDTIIADNPQTKENELRVAVHEPFRNRA